MNINRAFWTSPVWFLETEHAKQGANVTMKLSVQTLSLHTYMVITKTPPEHILLYVLLNYQCHYNLSNKQHSALNMTLN